jgi:molybdopterin/thiamine biosynthesis adenylyltransferase
MSAQEPLSEADRERYRWQLSVAGLGEEGQKRLKGASVLVSRCGGVGGAVAVALAAAGVGRLILAHAGNVRLNDLNRQFLMTTDGVGTPRADLAARRLRELNPTIQIDPVGENVTAANAERLVDSADLVAVCAPTFSERLLMNSVAVRQGKPLVDCAMYEMQAQLVTVIPGRTPCLACLYPEEPPHWKREFPVFGAVAGAIGCLGAMETIKVLTGLGEPLLGRMLLCDLGDMSFRKVGLRRRPDCPVCGALRMEHGLDG